MFVLESPHCVCISQIVIRSVLYYNYSGMQTTVAVPCGFVVCYIESLTRYEISRISHLPLKLDISRNLTINILDLLIGVEIRI